MEEEKLSDDMIPYVEFADNANERTPCVLVLDCSGSMRGEPIKQLNAGLKALEKELKDDIDASSRVQILIIYMIHAVLAQKDRGSFWSATVSRRIMVGSKPRKDVLKLRKTKRLLCTPSEHKAQIWKNSPNFQSWSRNVWSA